MIHSLLGSLYTLSCHTLVVLSFSNRSTIMGKATGNTYLQRDIPIFHSFFHFNVYSSQFLNFCKIDCLCQPWRYAVKLSSIFNNKAQISSTWATDYKTMLKKYKFIVGAWAVLEYSSQADRAGNWIQNRFLLYSNFTEHSPGNER